MWPLAIVLFGVAMLMQQMNRYDFDASTRRQSDVAAHQALLYASSVSGYLRANPGVTTPATTAQLGLPSWFPKQCSSDVCFQHLIIGGRAYITAKSTIPNPLNIKSLEVAQDGSLIVGFFVSNVTGEFHSTNRGVITMPTSTAVQVNRPTIIVGQ